MENTTDLVKAIKSLETTIKSQNDRLSKLEKIVFNTKEAAPAFQEPFPQDNIDFRNPQINKGSETGVSGGDKKEAQNKKNESFEENVAGNWFAKIGIVSLLLGLASFLKYAIDNNWINEVNRVIIGLILGLLFYALGTWLMKRYFVYGQVIVGGGLAILYLSVFAAFNFYHLIPYQVAFLGMFLITGAGVVAALYNNAMTLFLLVIFAGFATPFMLWTNEYNQLFLYSYVLLMGVAVTIVALVKQWKILPLIGFFCSQAILLATGGIISDNTERLSLELIFSIIFFLIYSLTPLISRLIKNEASDGSEQITVVTVSLAFFFHAWAIIGSAVSLTDVNVLHGSLCLGLSVYFLILFVANYLSSRKDEKLSEFLISASFSFLILLVPTMFDGKIITYGWLIEAGLLFVIAATFNRQYLKALAAISLGLVFFRLLFFELIVSGSSVVSQLDPFLNQRFFVLLFSVLVFHFGGFIFNATKRVFASNEDQSFFSPMKTTCFFLAHLFTIILINFELGNLFYGQPGMLSVAMSFWWIVYSIIILAIGFGGKMKKLRLGGLSLLSIAILKLFFVDLWDLGVPYRIVSSIVLGGSLLLISFVYQKYKDLIKRELL